MSVLADRIREYKAVNPELSNAEIGRRLGTTRSAVWKALNPDRTSEHRRTDNLKRRAAKREWERNWYRSEAGRGYCTTCGQIMGMGAAKRSSSTCYRCIRLRAHEKRLWIAAMWAQGRSMREIEAELGISHNQLGREMADMRRLGYDLPHRYRMVQHKRVAA